jgi:putative ABC transport system substrate-binding protein
MTKRSSLLGLTRQSISFAKTLAKRMDARVKPAHDEWGIGGKMLKRREFITFLGGAAVAWPLAARAQRRPRIAVLSINSEPSESKALAAFVDGLRALGYVEDRTVDIDARYAAGEPERLTPLAQELVALKPDVALVNSISPAIAIKGVATALPIVCAALADSAMPSLAASFARPGGSVTGIASSVEDLYAKLLELALDTSLGSARIGFLANPVGGSMPLYAQQVEAAARARGVTLLTQAARTPGDLALAFDGFAKQQAQVVIIPANGMFQSQNRRIAQLALAAHLPVIFPDRRNIEAGGLASYGVDVRENFRRAAVYVDKILKGAKPGDLPIEFPTKLELVINLKTAKALGLTIPTTMLGRADEVIE